MITLSTLTIIKTTGCSGSHARRLLAQGALSLDNHKITSPSITIPFHPPSVFRLGKLDWIYVVPFDGSHLISFSASDPPTTIIASLNLLTLLQILNYHGSEPPNHASCLFFLVFDPQPPPPPPEMPPIRSTIAF